MVTLRPLLVVTGTIRVEGGEQNRMKQTPTVLTERGDKDRVTVVQERLISKARRRANTISIEYLRRLRRLRIAKTPFGTLVDPTRRAELRALVEDATLAVHQFNKAVEAAAEDCELSNCLIVEPLRGERLAAVAGWLARKAKQDPDWKKTLAEVVAS
jgi:hypothetical protein